MRTTVWLAGSLVILGGLYASFDKVSGPTDEELRSPQLAQYKAEQVIGVDLVSKDETIRLVKVDAGWQLASPLKATAAGPDVEMAVSSLSTLKADRVVDEKVTEPALRQYGLEKPATRVVVHLKDSQETPTLDIGDRTPNDTGYYLHQAKGDAVYVGGNSLTPFLLKKGQDWRNRAPITYDTEKVERFEVKGPGVHFEATREKGATTWTFTQPSARRGETAEITRYLDGIKGAPIRTLFDQMAASDPKLKAVYTVKVWQQGIYEPVTLTLGANVSGQDGCYAVRGDALHEVFLYPRPSLEALAPDFSQLTEHKLFELDVNKAAQAEIQLAGCAPITATKEKDGTLWAFNTPVKRSDELGKLTALAYSLQAQKYVSQVLKADQLAKATATFTHPQGVFTLRDASGATLAALEVGGNAPGQNVFYVRKRGSQEIYLAEAGYLNDWRSIEKGLHEKAPGDHKATSSSAPAAASPAASPAPSPSAMQQP